MQITRVYVCRSTSWFRDQVQEKIREVAISSEYDRATVSASVFPPGTETFYRDRRCIHKAQTRHTGTECIVQRARASLPRKFYEPIHLLISIRSARRDKTRVRQSGYSGASGRRSSRRPIKALPVSRGVPCRGRERRERG